MRKPTSNGRPLARGPHHTTPISKMPSTSYASPVSSITDSAERAVANARFSSMGRRFAGPRLPLPLDFDTHAPEIALVTYQAAKVLMHTLERHGTIPPVTLSLVLLNTGVFLKPNGVLFGDVCLNPYAVLHLNQLERLVTSAFVHRDLFHLIGNMSGLVADGAELEQREGTTKFVKRVIASLGFSQLCLVSLSSLERKIRGRGGANAISNWFADAGAAFDRNLGLDTGVTQIDSIYPKRRVNNPATLPFYTSGVIGFSGVNYALKVAACESRPFNSFVLVFGIFPVPSRFSFWADLAVNTLISPSSGTFAAHFAGCVAGLITVYVPKMVKRGMGMQRAGKGRRLGGVESNQSRLVQGNGGGGSFSGNRLGGGDPSSANRSSNTHAQNPSSSRRKRPSIGKLLLAPFGAIKRAAQEGTPLVVHASFAIGCVLLQQILTRHAPGGLLSTKFVKSLPLVLEKAVRGF